MAKKEEDFDLDDWGDMDVNDLDFDFEIEKPQIPTGRDAVLATPVSAAKGAADAIIGPGKRRDLILKALPKEYTVAADAYDNLASTGQDIYRHARDEMTKAGQQLKYAGRAILPIAKPFLPKSIADKLAKATAADPTWANDYNPQEAGITAGLDSVFGQQSKEQAQGEAEDYVREKLEDKVRDIKQDRLHETIGHIGRNVEEITSYNRSVGTSWRKKMLELSFRQYYVMSDLLKANTETGQRTIDSLEAIVKNTALPDYAKEEFGEITAAMMKRKVIEVLSPANFARNYFRVLGDNVRSKITDFFGGVSDIAGMAAMGAEMANEDQGFDDTELTPEQRRAKMMQMGARQLGGFVANKYIAPTIKKYQGKAREWGENNEEVANFGQRAANILTSLPERLNTYANDPTYEGSEPAVVKWAMRGLAALGPSLYQERVAYEGYDANALTKAEKWSKRSDVTLNEILPGYLARIDRSVRRIYDPTAGLEIYDFKSKDFKSLTSVAKGIHASFANKDSKERSRKEIDELVTDIVSRDKEGLLTDEDKKNLAGIIEDRVMRPGQFDVRELAKEYGAYGSKGEGNLMEFFGNIAKDRLDANSIDTKAQLLLTRLRQRTGGSQRALDDYANMYSTDVLKRAKVLKEAEDGSMQFNRSSMSIYGDFDDFGDDEFASDPNAGQPPKGPKPKGGGGGRRTSPGNQGRIDAQVIKEGMRQAFWGVEPTLRDTIVSAIEIVNRKVENPSADNAKDALGSAKLTPEQYMAEILAQLKLMNVEPRIDEIIEAIHGVATSTVDPEKLEEYFKGKKGKIKSFFGKIWKSGKTRWRLAKRTGRNLRKRGWEAIQNFTGLGEEGAVRKLFTNAKDTVVGGIKGIKDGLLGERNIYDEDGNLILVGKLLKQGRYFSKDGTPIKSLDDIKGGIYTESGEPIISEEDMAQKLGKLRYWSGKGWEFLTTAPGAIASKARDVLGVAGRIQKFIRTTTTDALKAGYNQLRTGRDVYVKGQMETPRLHRNLMVKGWYVSETTGKAIRRGSDIDGPIITKHKEPIITAQELADPNFQLVYSDGQPVKSRWDELKGKVKGIGTTAKDMVVGGFKAVGRGFGFLKDVGASAWEAMTGRPVSGKTGGLMQRFLSGQNAVTDRLDKIYELLDERMKGGRRRRKGKPEDNGGDADGDGVRDNSYLDILRRKRQEWKERQQAKKEAKGEDPKKEGGGLLSKLIGAGGILLGIGKTMANGFVEVAGSFFKNTLGTFLTALAEKFAAIQALKKGADVLGDAADIAGDLGGADGERRRGRGRGGRFSRWGSKIKDGLGRMGGGRVGAAARAVGSAASAGWATLTGGAGLMSAAGSGLAWAARGAVTLAVGAVSSPWVLGATAAYLAYKIIKRKAPGAIDQIRFAQYGSQEYDREDLDDAAMLRYLEDQLGRYVSFDKSGVASLRGIDGTKTDEIAAGAGVDLKDEEKVGLWNAWFHGRFIPVFLLWMSRTRQHAPSAKLADIGEEGKVPFDIQCRIAENSVLDGGHPMFRINKGPLPEDINLLEGDRVSEIQDEKLAELKKAASLRPRSEPTVKDGQDLSKESVVAQTGDTTVKKKSSGWFSDLLQGAKEALGFADEEEEKPQPGAVDTIGVSIRKNGREVGKQLDALASVRVRAYGLFKLQAYRIEQLYRLEDYVYKNVARTSTEVKFQGDVDRIAASTSNFFGLMNSDEAGRTNYANWFKTRFMPVFMSYLTAFWKRVPNGDPFTYTLNQFSGEAFDIASDIIATKTNVGGKMVPVWSVEFSPWKRDNEFNLAAMTEAVNANMRFLDKLRKSLEMQEQKMANEGETKPRQVAQASSKNERVKQPQMTQEQYDRSPQKMMDAIFGEESANDPSMVGGSSTGGKGPDFDYSMGAMSEFGEGSGSYAELRKKPVRDFGSVAEMIVAASEMTGMDPGLMLTVGMMESSLKPKAGAGSSSAKGLYQFINSTWTEVLGKYGNKYGIPKNASVYDPWANTLMGAEYLKEGARKIQGTLGRPATPVDLYMTHFMGGGGGSSFLRNLARKPDAPAAADFEKAARANPKVFFKNGRMLSYAEVYDALQRRARNNFSNVAQYAKGSAGVNGEVSKPLADVNDESTGAIQPPSNQPVPLSTDDQAEAAEKYMAGKAATKATVAAKAFDAPGTTPPPMLARSEAATTEKAATVAAETTSVAQAARDATNSVEIARSSVAANTRASEAATLEVSRAKGRATLDVGAQQLEVQREILEFVKMIAHRAASPAPAPVAATGTHQSAPSRQSVPYETPRGIIPTGRG